MIGHPKFVYIHNNHFIAGNVMTHVINVIDNYIITKIATDNGTVVQADRHPDIMKRKIKRFEFPNSYKTKKLAIFYKFGIESIGYKNTIPVVRCIPVTNEHFNFKSCQFPVMDAVTVL